MRWSIIRTIWLREMRDQMRDRRTIFMILGLPLLLYPVLGYGVLQYARDFIEKPCVIGILGTTAQPKNFPPRHPASAGRSLAPTLAWLSATPLPGGDLAQWSGACALAHAGHLVLDYPYLIEDGRFTTFDRRTTKSLARALIEQARLQVVVVDPKDTNALEQHKVDLILKAPPDFYDELEAGEDFASGARPIVEMNGRRDDDRTRVALRRLKPLVEVWKQDLKKTRLARKGLPESFFEPVDVRAPEDVVDGMAAQRNMTDLIVRIFPFMLVMWSLAGALYPAVDLCAGEKERGTLETLLITPAGREEIVMGKFLTIWIVSSATALLNLLSMGVTSTLFAGYMPAGTISVSALLWCVVLSLPQSAFFSAISLAIGAYARSSKEGQYYLMPLFLVSMPLIFLTLAPGVTLNPLYSMVPVTGVALLMQRLMTAASLRDVPWAYFVPVLAPMALYSWLALRWAIEQFNREEVLFREAERLDLRLWLRRLFREKEPLPTTGQAFFCVALLVSLRWLSLGLGNQWPLEIHTIICQLAFVATPPLLMVLLLNTKPGEGLYLRWPRTRDLGLAALLALLLLPPMAGFAHGVALWLPHLLEGRHPMIGILRAIHDGTELSSEKLLYFLGAYALVPAVCEEIAFRGFVLHGLHRGFRPRNAVLLGAVFFAVFPMNVFLFVPTFILGVALGLLTVRSRSLLPAILFHLLHNSVLIALIPLRRLALQSGSWVLQPLALAIIGICLVAAGALLWWLYRKPYVDLARREAEERKIGTTATSHPDSFDTHGKV